MPPSSADNTDDFPQTSQSAVDIPGERERYVFEDDGADPADAAILALGSGSLGSAGLGSGGDPVKAQNAAGAAAGPAAAKPAPQGQTQAGGNDGGASCSADAGVMALLSLTEEEADGLLGANDPETVLLDDEEKERPEWTAQPPQQQQNPSPMPPRTTAAQLR